MKCIAGWMIPEMNWALKLACVEQLVLRLELSMALWLSPEDLHELVAGVHLFDWPLTCRCGCHCAANCFCERLAMSIVTTSGRGIGDAAMITASSGDDPEHHDEDADDGERAR